MHPTVTHLPLVCFQQMEGQRSYRYASCLGSFLAWSYSPDTAPG